MSESSGSATGFALPALLPWIAAVLTLALAAVAWVDRDAGNLETAAYTGAGKTELRTLRLALVTSEAENAALRGELDRLLAGQGEKAASPAGGGATAREENLPPSAEETHELSVRIRDSLTRAAAFGDEESNRQGATALLEAFQQGPEGFPALRDAYISTEDVKVRDMMLPVMAFSGGEEARGFLISQLQSETNPDLRRSLLLHSVRFATPDYAPSLKDAYLSALESETDPQTRAAAINGLRYAQGDDVQSALLGAIEDPSEPIRLAAIHNLASRPALRERLQEALARESSSRVREIGECRLLVGD